MDEIKRQVSRARRRMVFAQFLRIAPWALFATLLLTAIGIAIPKIWVLPATATEAAKQIWLWSWVGGGVGLGFIIAGVWTYVVRRDALSAAIEIDRRFGLKERVSSTLALAPSELDSEIGRALMDDAVRRVARIDVREQFRVTPGWRLALPLLPTTVVILLTLFVANAVPPKKTDASDTAAADARKQVKKSTEELKKKIEEQRKKAEEKGLHDADTIFKQLQEGLDKLSNKDDVDRKKALVELSDLSKTLEKRQKDLGAAEKIRDKMQQLKNMEKGPGDKVAKAMQDGNFKKAVDEAKKLKDQLEKGELSKEQREQLAKQLNDMKDKVKEMVDAQKQAKAELEKEIQKKVDAGDTKGAGELQNKLDQLMKQDKQMEKLNEMAEKLAKAAQAVKDGDPKQAAQQMDQIAENLQKMAKDMEELQTVDEMMNEIADAKDAMNCKECDGEGCEHCQSKGQGKDGKGGKGKNQKGRPGDGLGEGRGYGSRPEEETEKSFFDSKVGAKPKAGEAFRAGYADGKNLAGKSQEEIKVQITTSLSADPDPLTNQRLPKAQREQAKQYFERIRKGESN